MKAMAGQGEIRISGEQRDGGVAVTVADTGPGIPPELQSRVFDFSLPPSPEPRPQLGFGLWWVKTFVDRFGGRLLLESEPGQGSAFTVWLPAEQEEGKG
jgi:signal transduction histidine kinase